MVPCAHEHAFLVNVFEVKCDSSVISVGNTQFKNIKKGINLEKIIGKRRICNIYSTMDSERNRVFVVCF